MAVQRLPDPGGDNGSWGDILNGFLSVEHNPDGTLKASGSLATKADDDAVIHNSGDETINGIKTFTGSPLVPTPTTSTQATNKSYVDGVVASGAPAATTSAPGLVQLAGDLGGSGTSATAPRLAATTNVTTIINANTTVSGALQKANNLSDVASVATARTSLGLGGSATLNVGTTTSTVAAGNDSRITGALAATTATATYLPLTQVAATVTVNGTALANMHNPVDATSAAVTISLPSGEPSGTRLAIEKIDVTTNTITIAGSLRGTTTTISLVLQHETVELVADGSGSWWPIAGHKTLASLDSRYGGTTFPDRVSSIVSGLPLFAYGNSYLGNNTNAVQYYFDRIKAQMQPQFWFNAGNNGMLAADACSFAYGTFTAVRQGSLAYAAAGATGSGTFIPSTLVGGVVILDTLRNDSGLDGTTTSGGTTAKSRAGATNAFDAMIRLFRCGTKVENNAGAGVVRTGSWTTSASTSCSSGSVSYTTTPGDNVVYTVTLTVAARVSLIVLAIDNAANGTSGATFTTKVDSNSAVAGTTSDQMRKTAHTPPNNAFCQMAVDLGTLAVGTHTVTLTHTGTSGQQLFDDCLLVETATPPTILINKIAQLSPSGYTLTATYAAANASWATDQIYNSIIDTVVARFPSDSSIVTWDPNANGWNYSTYIGNTDGLMVHMNDAGNAFYANGDIGVLNTLAARAGLVRL